MRNERKLPTIFKDSLYLILIYENLLKGGFMQYTPHTQEEIQAMLNVIGMKSIDELFEHLPQELLSNCKIDLDNGKSEFQIQKYFSNLSKKNISAEEYPCFLGAGIYDHFIPSAVDSLSSRGEFFTAYTPYQAEASQGTLQAIMEYQTAITRLTGLDISNASLYDGSSALAEGILMALEITGKDKVILSKSIHPEWLEVVEAYTTGRDIEIIYVDPIEGESDFSKIKSLIDDDTACVCVQSPNFFGVIEDYRDLKKDLEAKKALLVVGTYPFALGFLEAPGNWGADIVVGDGQSLGNYMGFGGPHFGFLSCKEEHIRKIPGRVAGGTVDGGGKMGFCLTFQTREQHIRREKATSNICSNQALMALRAVIYLSLVGEQGLKDAAALSYHKAHYLAKRINELPSFELQYDKAFFNEFIVKSRIKAAPLNRALFNEGLIGGLDMESIDSQYENQILIAVTEKRTKEEMDHFIKVLEKFN